MSLYPYKISCSSRDDIDSDDERPANRQRKPRIFRPRVNLTEWNFSRNSDFPSKFSKKYFIKLDQDYISSDDAKSCSGPTSTDPPRPDVLCHGTFLPSDPRSSWGLSKAIISRVIRWVSQTINEVLLPDSIRWPSTPDDRPGPWSVGSWSKI